MSMLRKQRRLEEKARKKGKPVPELNYHIGMKKARKYGTGVKYSQPGGMHMLTEGVAPL